MGWFGDLIESVGGETARKAYDNSPMARDAAKLEGLARKAYAGASDVAGDIYDTGVATVNDLQKFKAKNEALNAKDRNTYHKIMAQFNDVEGPMTKEQYMGEQAGKFIDDQPLQDTTLDVVPMMKAATSLKNLPMDGAIEFAKKNPGLASQIAKRDVKKVQDMFISDVRKPAPMNNMVDGANARRQAASREFWEKAAPETAFDANKAAQMRGAEHWTAAKRQADIDAKNMSIIEGLWRAKVSKKPRIPEYK